MGTIGGVGSFRTLELSEASSSSNQMAVSLYLGCLPGSMFTSLLWDEGRLNEGTGLENTYMHVRVLSSYICIYSPYVFTYVYVYLHIHIILYDVYLYIYV